MRCTISHRTSYEYSEPASLSQNETMLQLRTTATQKVHDTTLTITPEPQYRHRRIDYFGNTVEVFMVQQPHDRLVVTAVSELENLAPMIVLPRLTPAWDTVAERVRASSAPADLDAYQFVFASPLTAIDDQLRDYGAISFPPGRPILEAALELVGRVHADFLYDPGATGVDTPVLQAFVERKGVCQDFAHLAISCLRSLGLAARYVSGYLETVPPPGGEKLLGVDASHAWLAVYIPEIGWIDLDPTNDMVPGESHFTLAWGRDYGDVTPVKGIVMGGGSHSLAVAVDVAPLAPVEAEPGGGR